jgi:hypothetical protein
MWPNGCTSVESQSHEEVQLLLPRTTIIQHNYRVITADRSECMRAIVMPLHTVGAEGGTELGPEPFQVKSCLKQSLSGCAGGPIAAYRRGRSGTAASFCNIPQIIDHSIGDKHSS